MCRREELNPCARPRFRMHTRARMQAESTTSANGPPKALSIEGNPEFRNTTPCKWNTGIEVFRRGVTGGPLTELQ
eukprot:5793010-Alexandrium_andersonii.AAC.1